MLKKLLIAILVLFVWLSASVDVLADSSDDVTVTGSPLYISISISPSSYTLGGIVGSGTILTNTTYYSNPYGDNVSPAVEQSGEGANVVIDGECFFTVTNPVGGETVDLTVNCSDFTGGLAMMLNSNDGSNGPTTYGGYSWHSGMTYTNKVIVKTSGSDGLYSIGLAGGNSLKIGIEIKTRMNAWAGDSPSTATMTVLAVAN